tara:strand:+ start:46 stop:249 length:204 start_codon:yes stop_codon:yes gene_type:complete
MQIDKTLFLAIRNMKYVVAILLLGCTILLGSKALINILDTFGFGPNIQNQNERIEENLRRLKSSRGI